MFQSDPGTVLIEFSLLNNLIMMFIAIRLLSIYNISVTMLSIAHLKSNLILATILYIFTSLLQIWKLKLREIEPQDYTANKWLISKLIWQSIFLATKLCFLLLIKAKPHLGFKEKLYYQRMSLGNTLTSKNTHYRWHNSTVNVGINIEESHQQWVKMKLIQAIFKWLWTISSLESL